MECHTSYKHEVKVKPKSRILLKVYLCCYNVIFAVSWFYILSKALIKGCFTQNISVIFSSIWLENYKLIVILQCLVFLEIAHILFEFVNKSGINIFQVIHCKVIRRFHMVIALLLFLETTNTTKLLGVGVMLTLWGVLDCIRYPYYALHIWKMSPSFLTWLRYSEFIVLYPIGFASEMYVWLLLLPTIKERANILYYYGLIIYLIWRLLAFPKNFSNMLNLKSEKI